MSKNEWNTSFNTWNIVLFIYFIFLTEDDLDGRNKEKQKHYLTLDIEGDE